MQNAQPELGPHLSCQHEQLLSKPRNYKNLIFQLILLEGTEFLDYLNLDNNLEILQRPCNPLDLEIHAITF